MHFLRALKNSRWCDLRLLIWPIALGLISFFQLDWLPSSILWESWQTAPFSIVVAHTTDTLIVPGILAATALIGAALARGKDSALNGLYLSVCLILALIAGAITWSTASFRLYATSDSAQIRTHGFYFRTFDRSEVVRLDSLEIRSGRGIIRQYPKIECADGRSVNIRDWEFAHRLAQEWKIPVTPEAEKIIRQYPARRTAN